MENVLKMYCKKYIYIYHTLLNDRLETEAEPTLCITLLYKKEKVLVSLGSTAHKLLL